MARRELSIEQVQRWVVSFLVIAVSSFPLGALTAAVHMLVGDGRRDDAMLLLVVMAALGVIALAAIRLVHRTSPMSAWLVLGLVPAALVATLVL